MAHIFSLVFLAFVSVSDAAFASTPFVCNITAQNSAEKKPEKIQKAFDFSKKSTVALPWGDRVEIAGSWERPSFGVRQRYGEGSNDYYLFWIECSRSLNCDGYRESRYGPKTKRDPFSMLPTTTARAMLGKREVFQFEPQAHGFTYQFTQYLTSAGTPVGVTLSCHD